MSAMRTLPNWIPTNALTSARQVSAQSSNAFAIFDPKVKHLSHLQMFVSTWMRIRVNRHQCHSCSQWAYCSEPMYFQEPSIFPSNILSETWRVSIMRLFQSNWDTIVVPPRRFQATLKCINMPLDHINRWPCMYQHSTNVEYGSCYFVYNLSPVIVMNQPYMSPSLSDSRTPGRMVWTQQCHGQFSISS